MWRENIFALTRFRVSSPDSYSLGKTGRNDSNVEFFLKASNVSLSQWAPI